MPAVAGNIGNIFLACRFAGWTAIFIIISDRANTRIVSAFIVFISHSSKFSLNRKKYLSFCDSIYYKLLEV
jgi:hypothetical protein